MAQILFVIALVLFIVSLFAGFLKLLLASRHTVHAIYYLPILDNQNAPQVSIDF